MKTKSLVRIFVIFLAITLVSGLAVFLTKEKSQPALSRRSNETVKPIEPTKATANELKSKKTAEKVKNSPFNAAKSEGAAQPETAKQPAEEKIKAVMVIDGHKYEAAVRPGGSVYDLMNLLKTENKINFSGENYSGLGFFVESIDELKNNPAGKNWLYYINGQPAPVGVSGYELKANDVIEWRYEEKSF